jgi:hypothetical protein
LTEVLPVAIYYEGQEWKSPEHVGARTQNIAKIIIGSAALSLFFTLLSPVLSLYGLIDKWLARTFMCFAWLVLVVGVLVSDYLCHKSKKHIVAVTLVVAVIVAVTLFWLDSYANKKRAEQEAANRLPPPRQ